MIKRNHIQQRMRSVILTFALLLIGCSQHDEFSQPSAVLQSRLEVFLRSNDPAPVVAWVTKDHGKAPGREMMVYFVGWGNLHPKRMAELLDRWPADSAALIIPRLQRAAVDSGQTVNFEIAEVSLGY